MLIIKQNKKKICRNRKERKKNDASHICKGEKS